MLVRGWFKLGTEIQVENRWSFPLRLPLPLSLYLSQRISKDRDAFSISHILFFSYVINIFWPLLSRSNFNKNRCSKWIFVDNIKRSFSHGFVNEYSRSHWFRYGWVLRSFIIIPDILFSLSFSFSFLFIFTCVIARVTLIGVTNNNSRAN